MSRTLDMSAFAVGAARLRQGMWFIEPQIAVEFASEPRLDWFVKFGREFAL